ncbi:MAG: hypothetical protein JJU03_02320 [Idiomarina sp.]|nr:hypothetical protein [Idiomarina sp.]
MIATRSNMHRHFSQAVFAGLVCLTLLICATREAQAQSYLIPDNDAFAGIIEQLAKNDTDAAEGILDAVPRSAKNADYHYLRGVVAMQSMNDAGAFRMARLARRMKGHFEDAIDSDPDHALAHFGLLQFHRLAPGVMGGRERQAEFHQQRLLELNSFLQFPAAIVTAQMEEDQAAERDIYLNWIAHSPQMFEAHYSYLTGLIGWGEYEQANIAMTEAFRHADEHQTQLIQYQQVRMAALAGLTEDAAEAQQLTEQQWFSEAYSTGLSLLALETRAEQLDESWLQMRLAQVEWALEHPNKARMRLEQVLSLQPDERLQQEVTTLYSKLDQH